MIELDVSNLFHSWHTWIWVWTKTSNRTFKNLLEIRI